MKDGGVSWNWTFSFSVSSQRHGIFRLAMKNKIGAEDQLTVGTLDRLIRRLFVETKQNDMGCYRRSGGQRHAQRSFDRTKNEINER